ADGVGALDDDDVPDEVRVELADGGVEVHADGEEEGAVGDVDELADVVAANARVGDELVALLHLDARGRRRLAEEVADVAGGERRDLRGGDGAGRWCRGRLGR